MYTPPGEIPSLPAQLKLWESFPLLYLVTLLKGVTRPPACQIVDWFVSKGSMHTALAVTFHFA